MCCTTFFSYFSECFIWFVGFVQEERRHTGGVVPIDTFVFFLAVVTLLMYYSNQ